jgi:ABC-type branched-subunit amino acid transport system substrate-binding protein
MITAEDRARALAARAYGQGARRFAMLVPEIAYGTRAAKAFRDEVTRLGGTLVVEVTYARDATQFVKPVAKLGKESFDALFVPDTAARLELISPQLAVDNLIVQPRSAKKPKRGKPILLLSTAEGVMPKFLKGSGRYANGAIFAPAFYPDEKDERIGRFVGRFRAAFGDWPTALDAYAYDGALLIRSAVESGARDRAAVAASLAGLSLAGVTGEVEFDAARGRADRGILYECRGDGAGGWEIRALRDAVK